jgi:hypothetical protein
VNKLAKNERQCWSRIEALLQCRENGRPPSVRMNEAGQAGYPFQLGNGLRLELRKAVMRSRIDERR